jgi:Domain of unknown function (DUF4259)
MGAWGTGPFDNDDAGDFADAVAGRGDLAAIKSIFDQVLVADYVEAPLAWEAVAGADIMAMLAGQPRNKTDYPESIQKWSKNAARAPSADEKEKARRALDRILSPQSELLELWEDSDDLEAWKASLEDIKRRLA